MKRAILLLFVALSARADDADVAKGLENLGNIYSIAGLLEAERAFGAPPSTAGNDPWGTPYRVDVEAYRIVSAGSDRKFDEASWKTSEQIAGTAGDVVFANGNWVRTNHNWLCRRVNGGAAAAALRKMRELEHMFMYMRTPPMRTALGPRLTALGIERVAEIVEQRRGAGVTLETIAGVNPRLARDAWGTPLRLEIEGGRYRIASAGADRKFDPESWSRAAKLDPAEDIVFENGAFKRKFDERRYLESQGVPTADPVKQPPDARLQGTPLAAHKDATAPVVVKRVEPEYPETYRKLRISGIVILELSILETGAIEDIAVIKSIGPAIDQAAYEAVRKWTFEPAKTGGKAVPSLFKLTINFKLN